MEKIQPFWKIFAIVLGVTVGFVVFLIGMVWALNTITYSFGFWYAVMAGVLFIVLLNSGAIYVFQYGMIKDEDK